MRKRDMRAPRPRIRHLIAQMARKGQRQIRRRRPPVLARRGPWRHYRVIDPSCMTMAVAELSFAVSARTEAEAAVPRVVRQVQVYCAAVFVMSLGAFVLGIEGRFPGGLFIYPPPVDWLPPLSRDQWLMAVALHQQDPIYAACGGIDRVLLMESDGHQPLVARKRRKPIDRRRIDEKAAGKAALDAENKGTETHDKNSRTIDLHLPHNAGHRGLRLGPGAHRKGKFRDSH